VAVRGDELCFPFAAQVARVDRRRENLRTGQQSTERVWVITSLPAERASEQDLAALVRGHWSIENQLHWRRDVSFQEDRSRVRHPRGARTMATLRNLAIAWQAHPRSHAPPRKRQRTLPQRQRYLAGHLHFAVAAIVKPWRA
jgi:predicted transposase YbfD/YdcC